MPLFHLTNEGIESIRPETFTTLRVSERSHIQRVLRGNLEVIAPDLFLIAEEFGEWDASGRRIDLLAIDSSARLVVIELKRTEDGGHAELQAVRYAAMVSAMTFDQAVAAHTRYLKSIGSSEDARDRILSFLGWSDPMEDDFGAEVRIILVSADFSKELTTAVLWLRSYDIDIRCVRLRPHVFDGRTLLNVETVIPLAETAEYQIRVREKEVMRRQAVSSIARSQKYDVYDGDDVERRLFKRRALHRIVRALSRRGVPLEKMTEVVPSLGQYLFVSVGGNWKGEEFLELARQECERLGRAFDPARYSIADDDLIHAAGRTYAVTNQIGTNTEAVLGELTAAFPFDDVRWERSEVTDKAGE